MSSQVDHAGEAVHNASPSNLSKPVCLCLLFDDVQLEAFLLKEFQAQISFIAIASLSGDVANLANFTDQEVFLISDWDISRLAGGLDLPFEVSQFALALLVQNPASVDEFSENVICFSEDEHLAEKMVVEVMSRLFPGYDEKRLMLESQNRQQLQFLEHIGKELSTFYHNINNPLTVLSGNIQLLQMLTDSINISADLMKPISDIATISSRFEQDLKSIAHLKEKIKSGALKIGNV